MVSGEDARWRAGSFGARMVDVGPSEFADDYFASILKDRLADLPPHLATVRKIAAWYKVPKIKDLYPVPGKHYTADRQPADTLTAAAVDGSGNVPNNGVASTTTAAAALALVI